MARIVKLGKVRPSIFRGRCPSCEAIIEANRSELRVDECSREHYEFAHFQCLQCQASMVMYPSKGEIQ